MNGKAELWTIYNLLDMARGVENMQSLGLFTLSTGNILQQQLWVRIWSWGCECLLFEVQLLGKTFDVKEEARTWSRIATLWRSKNLSRNIMTADINSFNQLFSPSTHTHTRTRTHTQTHFELIFWKKVDARQTWYCTKQVWARILFKSYKGLLFSWVSDTILPDCLAR